jgi:hypothetical protein
MNTVEQSAPRKDEGGLGRGRADVCLRPRPLNDFPLHNHHALPRGRLVAKQNLLNYHDGCFQVKTATD